MSRITFPITSTCCRCCCYCRGAVGGDDLCWEVPKCQFLLLFFFFLSSFSREKDMTAAAAAPARGSHVFWLLSWSLTSLSQDFFRRTLWRMLPLGLTINQKRCWRPQRTKSALFFSLYLDIIAFIFLMLNSRLFSLPLLKFIRTEVHRCSF